MDQSERFHFKPIFAVFEGFKLKHKDGRTLKVKDPVGPFVVRIEYDYSRLSYRARMIGHERYLNRGRQDIAACRRQVSKMFVKQTADWLPWRGDTKSESQ